MPTVLDKIVANRRTHLARIRRRIGENPVVSPSTRSLYDSLGADEPSVIMECKSASPSLGSIRPDYHPDQLAAVYSRYAAGISVLCEPDYFNGDYDHLATVTRSTHLPVLCKDFIIDPVQIYAARYFGADAILLMLSVLSNEDYGSLSSLANSLNLDVLTEVISPEEMRRATALGAKIIGINNRNLNDLSVEISRTEELAGLAPSGVRLISESGIRTKRDIERLSGVVDGFLVGTNLVRERDVDFNARKLLFGENKVCGLQTPHEAQAARAAGALYGGLIIDESSPRHVSRETASNIVDAEPGLKYVGVSRRTEDWDEFAGRGLYAVQVHSPLLPTAEEELEYLASVQASVGPETSVWRAISMSSPNAAAIAADLCADETFTLVLDNGSGGSGSAFDWERIPPEVLEDSLLAGGIGPENVTAALTVGARGLDFNSQTENALGHKDAHKLFATFNEIRRFNYDR